MTINLMPRDIKSPRDMWELLNGLGILDRIVNDVDVRMASGGTLAEEILNPTHTHNDLYYLQSQLVSGNYSLDQSERVAFTKDSVSPVSIRSMGSGEVIYRVIVEVTEVFSGMTMQVGFPVSNGEIIDTGEVDLTTLGIYEFDVYRTSVATETLQIYLSGSSVAGAGVVYVSRRFPG